MYNSSIFHHRELIGPFLLKYVAAHRENPSTTPEHG